jgi:predicted DNA binding CopG/RHH family protein
LSYQISIDNETGDRVRKAAKQAGLPMEEFIRRAVQFAMIAQTEGTEVFIRTPENGLERIKLL